ncbi:DUF416 family protein [Corallococcus sp. CA053C]|uniref:DUF416 family protein n=1 Tax=Corallococcus sp. CA053C TaxID=2316732 RepID=UPI000EA32CB7|nr:DUF416 family protein [Corallococcus sp. CA053C]RKH09906.1 DUF416 family protein [Corallococcus sp. CA053C]
MAMKVLRFDEGQVAGMLERLPPRLRVIFAASCAERLLPAYVAFAHGTGRGDAAGLKNLLAWLWESLAIPLAPESEVQERVDACMSLIPHEDDGPWADGQAPAEDAGAAVAYALRCRKGGESQEAAWAARRVYEAVDHHVVNVEGIDVNVPGAGERILGQRLVQAELARQRRDLDELLGDRDGDVREMAARFQARAKEESAIFFGLRS